MLYFVSRVNNDSITMSYFCKLCVYTEINLLFCSVLKSSVIKRVVLMMSLNFHETKCWLNNVFLTFIIKFSVYKL